MSSMRKSHSKIKLDCEDACINSIVKSQVNPATESSSVLSDNSLFGASAGSVQFSLKMESPTSNATASAATAFKPLINPFSIDALIGGGGGAGAGGGGPGHNSSSRSSSNSTANLSLGQHLSRAASLTAAFNSSQHSPYHLSNLAAAAAAAAAASSASPTSPYHSHHASSVHLHPSVASHPSHHQLSYLQAAFTIAAAAAQTAPNGIGLPSGVTSTSNQG